MQNSVVMFTFFTFEQKYPFCANLVQNAKIISLSLNLVATLTWICRTQWCCSLSLFSTGNTPFLAHLVQKIKIIHLSWNLVSRLIRTWRIQWWCSLFMFLTGNTLLGPNFVQNVKLLIHNRTLTFQTKMCYFLHWKPFKYDKNAFYFILKALFVLKIFKFLSWLFSHVKNTA